MNIIAISGKARHGKDYAGELMAENLKKKGYRVLVTHYADLLKYLCREYFNWNGEKDAAGRHLLQYVGTDVVRKKKPDFWVDFVVEVLELFDNEWDYVIIPDTRFPNEINRLYDSTFPTVSVRIIRPNFDSGLSEEAKAHISETALDNFEFDYTIANSGDDDFKGVIASYVDSIENHFIYLDEGEHLTCNRCGYKQYDEETINAFKRDYPHICVYDIPYLCGACQDNMNDEAYYAFLKGAKRTRIQSILNSHEAGDYQPSDMYRLLSEMNKDWDKLFPTSKTYETVELATFPDNDENYCKHFTVPTKWLEKKLANMNGETVSVEDFLDGYLWDHTFAVYQDAKTDGVIISEEEGGKNE